MGVYRTHPGTHSRPGAWLSLNSPVLPRAGRLIQRRLFGTPERLGGGWPPTSLQRCPEFRRFWDDGTLLPQTRQTDIPRLASWLPGYALRGGTRVWLLRDALRLLPQRWPIFFVAPAFVYAGYAWPQAVALTGLVAALAEVLFAIVTVRLLDRR